MTTIERDPATLSPIEAWLVSLPDDVDRGEAIAELIRRTPAGERQAMQYSWNALWARPNQRLPEGDWRTWFIRAGRGYGKTRTGSEGVRKLVEQGRARAVTIIGSTAADARDVMIEGPESGLLAVHPNEVRPVYKPSVRLLEWPNGALGHVRSAEEPDGIRGLNSELVWGDEPASWKSGVAAWDNAMLGNRLGDPHSILTGTPRPLEWLKDLEKQAGTVVATGSTYDNLANLAQSFIDLILARYEGTRLGRQELHALYLEDVEGALWRMLTIESTRFTAWSPDSPWTSLQLQVTPEMRRAQGLGLWLPETRDLRRKWVTWVGVDPPGETAECGIIVATAPDHAKAGSDHCVILEDATVAGAPEVWGPAVAAAVRKWNAEGAVVERNQGGDMVRSTVHAADPSIRVEKVTSTESKYDRAEPVSTLHSRGWIHLWQFMPQLETQMTTWVPDESKSPDRLDAMVHVVTKLLKITPGRQLARVHSPIR